MNTTIFSHILFLGAAVLIIAALLAWRSRRAPAARYMAVVNALLALYVGG